MLPNWKNQNPKKNVAIPKKNVANPKKNVAISIGNILVCRRGAEGCALIAAVPKTACNFQHQEYAALLRENFCTRGNFIREIDCDYQKELKISTRCRKWIFAEKCKQFWEPLQSASTCKHLKQMTVLDTESHELSKKTIKKLNFDWYSGQPVGHLIWKSSSLHLCHQLVKMIRTG